MTSIYAVYNADNNTNDSFGSRNGTAVGGLTYSTGKIGQAFNFNGTNSYVNLPDNSLNLTGDFTISLWVYPTSGAAQAVLSNRAFTSGTINKGWTIGINNISGGQTSKVTFLIPQGPSSTTYTGWEFTTTSLTLNAWNHVLITRESGVNSYCWVNNISQSYLLKGTGINIALDPTYDVLQYNTIGAYKNLNLVTGAYLAAGTRLDAMAIWNRQLTSTERADLYNSGTGKQYPF